MSPNNVVTFLWYDSSAEEAAKHYVTVFNNAPRAQNAGEETTAAAITHIQRKSTGLESAAEEAVQYVSFTINSRPYIAFNGGPHFKLSEAMSLMVECEDQADIDYFWEKLIGAGGEESRCGWLKDPFGLSWQVTPRQWTEWLGTGSEEQKGRYMSKMMEMGKLDIEALRKVREGA